MIIKINGFYVRRRTREKADFLASRGKINIINRCLYVVRFLSAAGRLRPRFLV